MHNTRPSSLFKLYRSFTECQRIIVSRRFGRNNNTCVHTAGNPCTHTMKCYSTRNNNGNSQKNVRQVRRHLHLTLTSQPCNAVEILKKFNKSVITYTLLKLLVHFQHQNIRLVHCAETCHHLLFQMAVSMRCLKLRGKQKKNEQIARSKVEIGAISRSLKLFGLCDNGWLTINDQR